MWEWLRVLDEMENQPKILLLENVVGLLSTNKGNNYRILHTALVERGYDCGAIVLNASYFVPQSRPRRLKNRLKTNPDMESWPTTNEHMVNHILGYF